MADPITNPGEVFEIDRNMPCPHCGYNLRTLQSDAVCPECGRKVRLAPNRPFFAGCDPGWVARVAGSLAIANWSKIVGVPLLMVGILFFHNSDGAIQGVIMLMFGLRPASVGLVSEMAHIDNVIPAAVFLSFYCLVLASLAMVGSKSSSEMPDAAALTRSKWLLLVALLVACAAAFGAAVAVNNSLPVFSVRAMCLLVIAADALYIWAVHQRLAELARRIPDPSVQKANWAVMCARLGTLAVLADAGLPQSRPGLYDLSLGAFWAMTLTSLGNFVFGFWYEIRWRRAASARRTWVNLAAAAHDLENVFVSPENDQDAVDEQDERTSSE